MLETIADDHLLDNVKRVGEHLAHQLETLTSPLIAGTRGSGLWRAVVLNDSRAGAWKPPRALVACSSMR